MSKSRVSSRPEHEVASRAMDDLVALEEVIGLIGRAQSTAARVVNEPSFPQPVKRIRGARVWRRSEVIAWAKAHPPRRPGRPAKASTA